MLQRNPAISLLVTFIIAFCSRLSHSYTLSWELRADDFLRKFDYWDGNGTTKDPSSSASAPSAAFYTPKEAALEEGLVFITYEGNFRLGVDSRHIYSEPALRPSVRITSHMQVQRGLMIIEAPHVASGMGAWPAMRLKGQQGLIDIYEGINNATQNTVTYHTSSGCLYDPTVQQTVIMKEGGTNCDDVATSGAGCGGIDPSVTSFGAGANKIGGSFHAVEWTGEGIKMWHFNRFNAPPNIWSYHPNPVTWGTPVTDLASTYCDMDSHFGPQSLIINIELCGTWAGAEFPGGSTACLEYVRSHPEAFDHTYFEIASVKYFEQ